MLRLDSENRLAEVVKLCQATQQAFAADGPSVVFVEVGLSTLSQSFIEHFVAAAEMRALCGHITKKLDKESYL